MPKHRLFSLGARLPDDDMEASGPLSQAWPIWQKFKADIAAIFGADAVRDESQTIVTRGPRPPAATAAAPPAEPSLNEQINKELLAASLLAAKAASDADTVPEPASPDPDDMLAKGSPPEPHTKHGRKAAP